MLEHLARRLSRTTGAAALLWLAAAIHPASAAPTRVHYQEQASMACAGGQCRAHFIDLPESRAFDVEGIRCHITVSGAVDYSYAYFEPDDPPRFHLPLSAIWQRPSNGLTAFTLDLGIGMLVPRGGQLIVATFHSGSNPNGFCSAVGERLIYDN